MIFGTNFPSSRPPPGKQKRQCTCVTTADCVQTEQEEEEEEEEEESLFNADTVNEERRRQRRRRRWWRRNMCVRHYRPGVLGRRGWHRQSIASRSLFMRMSVWPPICGFSGASRRSRRRGGGGFGTKLAYRSGSFIINRALGFGHGKIPGKTPAHNRKATNRRNAPEAERSGLSKTRFSGTHTHTHIRPSIDMV